jgi:hypothetical protein
MGISKGQGANYVMMRIIKLSIISVVVIFIILLLISLMIPSTVRTSRAINIEAPENIIYPLLADTANWSKWNDLKNDRIQIKPARSDSNLIKSDWSYGNRTIHSFYRIERLGDVTVVQWYFEFPLKWYPWEKFASITFEKQFGPPMETSLINLKNLVTNSP